MTSDKEKAEVLIHNIAAYIDQTFNDGLSNGAFGEKSGCLLFMAYYVKYVNPQSHYKIDKYLDSIFSDLSKGIYIPSYCDGVSGILYILNHLNKYNLINIDIQEAESCYVEYLNNELTRLMASGAYDFFHGALGIIYYFLSLDIFKGNNLFFNSLVAKILSLSISDDNNSIYWEDRFNGVSSNISLSHGMSSIILLLSYIQNDNLLTIAIKDKIDKSVNFILSQKNKPGNLSCYPNINMRDDFTSPRLAWCYGDLGIGIALWQISRIWKRDDLLQESIRIFKSAEKRKNLKENRVDDACFCHGTAGISCLFKYMYYNTNIESFSHLGGFWLNHTIEIATNQMNSMCFSNDINSAKVVFDRSLLDGISGIGMTLVENLYGDGLPPWSSIFLLKRFASN